MAITRPRKASATSVARSRHCGAASLAVLLVTATAAHAQTWRAQPSLSLESTLTDNVGLSPSGEQKADWVNQLTPTLRFLEIGAHPRFSGVISVPMLVYARTSENNYVAPQVNANGTIEAIEKFLFVDASINISQQFQTPFGARPNELSSATQNRYTAQSYGVSPYIKGNLANNVDYELRDNNTWTITNGAFTQGGGNAYTNEIVGHVTREPTPVGWSLEYDRTDYAFTEQQSQRTAIARARAIYQPDPAVRVFVSAGYEENQLTFTQENGATYGVGIEWRPTDRTTANAAWEHRFFGTSYRVDFAHRTPLSVWSIQASRDITNYPRQIASLTPGSSVPGLLNSLFIGSVPDPLQRQTLVDQIIRDRGLPTVLLAPVSLFTQQITLVESLGATFGILGARNGIFFTAFRSRNQPIEGTDAGDPLNVLTQFIDSTQIGTGAAFTHQLASNMTFSANLDWTRTTSNDLPGASTRQGLLRALLSRNVSAYTTVYAGARFQKLQSTVTSAYDEAAVLVGVVYQFR